MRIVFTILLTCLTAYSIAQSKKIRIGSKDFKGILFSDNQTIYLSTCENSDDYLLASKSVILYDSMMNVGYLNSYKYIDAFDCADSIDHLIIEQIKSLLSEKKGTRNEISILFGMEDKNKKFIGVLFLFKKKRFNKFLKKANNPATKTYSGEKILMWEYKYHIYANEFILAKTEDKLYLIPVSRSY